MTLSARSRIGPYEILGLIGTGGMGEVYRAKDTTLGRDVAIKVLPEAFAEDEDRLARFEREARTLASVNHPNIAIIYGFEKGQVGTGPYTRALVMELVEGPTLAERIEQVTSHKAQVTSQTSMGRLLRREGENARRGPAGLPIDEALNIARQVADALEAAHEQGVVHRDLKPANVKVRPDGTVKVLDFGLAKLSGPSAALREADTASPTVTTPAMTQAGVILGTAAYMSPEQARGRDADARSDVFAFGCVLYEMLTGRRAFAGDDVGETLAFVITKEPDWTLLPADVPMRLRTLLSRCLAKDRRQRLQAIGEARIAIDELLAERRAPGATSLPAAVMHDGPSRFAWLKWTGAALGGAAVAALVVTRAGSQLAPVEIPPTRFTLETPPDVQFMTTGTGQTNRFALSPDGRNLVFIGQDADGTGLWLRPLGSLEAHELPGTEGAIGFPFWSPDGQAVAFFTTNRLRVIDLAQGTTRTICEIPSLNAGNANGANGTWNTEGTIVFSADPGEPLSTVPANGGTRTALPIFADRSAGALLFLRPWFLPNQQRFLFAARSTDAELNGVFVASLTDPRTTRVLDRETVAVYAPGRLLFVRDGVLMAQPFDVDRAELRDSPRPLGEVAEFVGDTTGSLTIAGSILVYSTGVPLRTELIAVDRTGKRTDTLAAPASHGNFDLSPDEKRLVITRPNGQTRGSDLWLIDLARRVETRLTFGQGSSGSPVWSPDGKTIAFNRNTPLPPSVWLVPADGGPERRLLEVRTGNVNLNDWSPDGKVIVFNQSPRRLMAVDVSGEATLFAFLETAGGSLDESHFSPDGKWIAYNSDESGTWQVYVAPFPATGQRWQISSDGGVEPRWRGDGRELFYRTLAGEIVAVDVTPQIPFEAGVPRVLFRANLNTNPRSDEYAVTGDGQRFYLKSIAQGDRPALTVVINWDREVGQP